MSVKKIAYLFILVATVVTLGVGFASMDTFSLAALIFLLLAIAPYALMFYIVYRSKKPISVTVNAWLSIFLTLLGSITLIYEMFFHKDAQSALAFVVIPVYQLCIFAIVSFAVSLIAKRY
jgi:hypothetical protein